MNSDRRRHTTMAVDTFNAPRRHHNEPDHRNQHVYHHSVHGNVGEAHTNSDGRTPSPSCEDTKERTISSPRSTRHPLSHIYSRHPLPEIRRRVPMESVRQRHTTMGTRSPHPYTSSSNLSLSVRRLSLSSRSESRSRRKVISINSRCSIPSRRSYDVNHSKASCTERCM